MSSGVRFCMSAVEWLCLKVRTCKKYDPVVQVSFQVVVDVRNSCEDMVSLSDAKRHFVKNIQLSLQIV